MNPDPTPEERPEAPTADTKPMPVEIVGNGHLPASRKAKAVETWHGVLRMALAMPGAHVDRESFLRSVLKKHVTKEQLALALDESPARAGIDPALIDAIANRCINTQTYQVTAASFITGLPGGALMAAMVPADIAQFYYQSLILCQKLAYLYGWPDLLENRKVDENTLMHMTMFVGVMMGAAAANIGVAHMAEIVARRLVSDVPRRAFTDQVLTHLVAQVAKWIGIKVTRRKIGEGLSHLVPIVGAVMSAGMSYASIRPMARRLRSHLAELPLARGES